MEIRRVDTVHPALQALQVVALLQNLGGDTLQLWEAGPLEVRERRNVGPGAHVGPDDAASLSNWIGALADLVFERAIGWLGRLVDTAAFDIVFPGVIEASE